MAKLEQIKDAIDNALNYLKNQDLSAVGRQTQGKLINAQTQVKNLILHNVSNCTSCGIEINYKGLCEVCYCRGNDAYKV